MRKYTISSFSQKNTREKKHSSLGFTLVELIIVISVIWIMATMAPRINFTEINNQKRAEVFTSHIWRVLENARNNALFGRSVWALSPDAWQVSVWLANSWSILTEYLSGSTWIAYVDQDFSFTTAFPESISNVNCNDSGDIWTSIWIIQFYGRNVSYSWACTLTDKTMIIDTSYYWYTWSLNINAVSWVIETND
jgi:prepilin-type N-terminal cleavage/methylation domain-containing protein